jgi:hypothetical protein
MIKYLAHLFRDTQYFVGVPTPPPGTGDRTFMFAWLGFIAFLVAFVGILFHYFVPFLNSKLCSTASLWAGSNGYGSGG